MSFDIESFLGMPRLKALRLSPDGERLVVAIATPNADETKFTSALWEVDPDGERPARRLTRSAEGDANPTFLPDSSLLFTSKRQDPDAAEKDREPDESVLWLLPPDAGEARLVARPPGGIGAVAVARDDGRIVLAVPTHPGVATWDADADREKQRTDAKVQARLYDGFPIRWWDRYLGPRENRLWTAPQPEADGDARLTPTDLTPHPDGALHDEATIDVAPDGGTVVTSWWRTDRPILEQTFDLVAIDTASGEHRTLISDGNWYDGSSCSPDGRTVAVIRTIPGEPGGATYRSDLLVVDLESGESQVLTDDIDLWPGRPVWTPDGTAVYFTADEQGHCPVFRLEVQSREVTRLTASGSFGDVQISPDGASIFALRSTIDRPPHPVRIDASTPDQEPTELPSPVEGQTGPGRVERVSAIADDGAEIASWLVLPESASSDSPAPLVVFIHGGPISSWNGWHWRWNPHVLAEHGYAVLMPDPALSTGYGQDFIQRGWGRWGFEPYTDLMAAVDGVVARADVDDDRTAAMGGSFGGYMANWVAGQTDRFRAIITHASIWNMRAMHGTSDLGPVWDEREFGNPYEDLTAYEENSPDRFIGRISTPMLVIHGENDHRCHISDALRLWSDLMRHDVEAKFLYFPDENHWVLKPQNARIWYETVLAFLDHHVLDRDWERPTLL